DALGLRSHERLGADYVGAYFAQPALEKLLCLVVVSGAGSFAEFLAAEVVGAPIDRATLPLENPSLAAHYLPPFLPRYCSRARIISSCRVIPSSMARCFAAVINDCGKRAVVLNSSSRFFLVAISCPRCRITGKQRVALVMSVCQDIL